ncbi:MAG: TatD family hydrolase [Bacteroidales bacterium]|nr:TatD family hydrolase [Bacteroidales bacterium]
MILVDTHTHLYLEQFDEDRTEVVEAAIAQDVKWMLLPNIDGDSLDDMKKLHLEFPNNCLPMMGLHPTSVKENYEEELRLVEKELQTGKYIAVGEIGMDLYWDKEYAEQQKDAFRRQLKMAKKYDLPVSIHIRDSFDIAYHIVKEESTDKLQGIFHCFTGGKNEAKQIMDIGFKMGIGGIVTFKNAGLAEVVETIPEKYLVLETDAPFLTPAPFRGKRNQSVYLKYIAEKLAEIKSKPVEEIAEITTKNALEVFTIE